MARGRSVFGASRRDTATRTRTCRPNSAQAGRGTATTTRTPLRAVGKSRRGTSDDAVLIRELEDQQQIVDTLEARRRALQEQLG
ncbi:MAG: hypothetical protein ACYC2O_04330 [Microthrixaceae bacterium]